MNQLLIADYSSNSIVKEWELYPDVQADIKVLRSFNGTMDLLIKLSQRKSVGSVPGVIPWPSRGSPADKGQSFDRLTSKLDRPLREPAKLRQPYPRA